MKTTFSVRGMSCAACAAHVEKAVGELPGVGQVSVSLLLGRMQVSHTCDAMHFTLSEMSPDLHESENGGLRKVYAYAS